SNPEPPGRARARSALRPVGDAPRCGRARGRSREVPGASRAPRAAKAPPVRGKPVSRSSRAPLAGACWLVGQFPCRDDRTERLMAACRKMRTPGFARSQAGKRKCEPCGSRPTLLDDPVRRRVVPSAMRRGVLFLFMLRPALAPAIEPADVTVASTARAVRVQTGAAVATIRRGHFRLRLRGLTSPELLTR